MKKLLLLGLSFALVGGNMLAVVPPQFIFTDIYAYDCISIDIDKIVVANAVVLPKYHSDLYHQLTNMWLTKENILNLINTRYNTSGVVLTSVRDLHLVEILKEQQNILIRKNHKLVMDCGPFIGDNAAQDYGVFLVYGTILMGIERWGNILPKDVKKVLGVGPVITLGSLYKLYRIYHTVRHNESEINKIDEIIKKIESMQDAEREEQNIALTEQQA